MDVPDPALAQQVADALNRLAAATEQSSWEVTGTVMVLTRHWDGHAADAAETLLRDVAQTSAQTADALRGAATTWVNLAHDLRGVEAKVRWVDDIGKGFDVLAVVNVLQGGLDLVTDSADAATAAEAETGRLAAKAMLKAAIERMVGDVLSKKAVLLALRAYGIHAVGTVLKSALETTVLDRFEYGRISIADVLSPSVAEALLPSPVSVVQDFIPTVHRATPPGFATADDFDLATTAADDWVAENAPGALISVGEGPGGTVRVTLRGDVPHLTKGRTYDVGELAGPDPSLAALLEQIGVWADGPVTLHVG